MEKLKKILHRMLVPHTAILIILVPVAAAMLIYAFAFENAHPVLTYISYFLSAYALTIVCVRSPAMFRKAKQLKQDNKYLSRYFNDPQLRVKISLYGAVLMNTAYAIFQLGLGFYHRSVWFYALAVYYVLLALMRYFLLKETLKKRAEKDLLMEYLLYRFCGVFLLAMNLALSVIVFYIAWQGRGFEHNYIVTIAMAAYTFTTLVKAIVNVVKYRKYQSPVMSASKAISLAAASVSMLTLETAMLSAFGEEGGEQFRTIVTSTTGAVVCLFVLAIAVYMIVRSTKEIKRIKGSSKL